MCLKRCFLSECYWRTQWYAFVRAFVNREWYRGLGKRCARKGFASSIYDSPFTIHETIKGSAELIQGNAVRVDRQACRSSSLPVLTVVKRDFLVLVDIADGVQVVAPPVGVRIAGMIQEAHLVVPVDAFPFIRIFVVQPQHVHAVLLRRRALVCSDVGVVRNGFARKQAFAVNRRFAYIGQWIVVVFFHACSARFFRLERIYGFRFPVSGFRKGAGQHSDIGQPDTTSRKSATNYFSRLPTTDYRLPTTGNRYYVVGHANAVLAGGCSSRLFASTEGDPPSCHS